MSEGTGGGQRSSFFFSGAVGNQKQIQIFSMDPELDRRTALARAIELWRERPGFLPLHFLPHHDCLRDSCEVVEVPYAAKREGDLVMVRLFPPPERVDGRIDRPVPLYGCPTTRGVHPCGPDACEYASSELTCPLTGLELGQDRKHAYWTPYRSENWGAWKWDVRNLRRVERLPQMLERAALRDGSLGDAMRSASFALASARRRARIANKSEAFDVAFLVCAIVLSDERFAEALRHNREQRAKREAQALRVAVHMQQRRRIVSASGISKSLASGSVALPVLVRDDRAQLEQTMGYAHRCIALWFVLCARVDASIREMSFRDFCVAALNLFGKGHVVVNPRNGLGEVFARQDTLLSAFPVNGWSEKKIYADVDAGKITGIVGRAEARLVSLVNECVAKKKGNTAYLRFAEMRYDELDEAAFRGLKR